MSAPKRALITGVTGQDGSYLAELLDSKGYEVYGLLRRSSNNPLVRIEDLPFAKRLKLIYGDLRDMNAVARAIQEAKPDEIYNLAGFSDVGISFKCPEETMEINYFGVGRLVLEAMEHAPQARIYQASTSEMYGATPAPQDESSPFEPQSPYAVAKVRAHEDFIKGYREKHGTFTCSGILFNHESPRRGEHFVTRKITISLAKIKLGLQEELQLGNLDAKRDWGFAGEYVEMMWRMLQAEKADDFVIATGESHSVRDFVNEVAATLDYPLTWEGEGLNEVAKDKDGVVRVRINEKHYRPAEVRHLEGNAAKAKRVLGWEPNIRYKELAAMMAKADFDRISKLPTRY